MKKNTFAVLFLCVLTLLGCLNIVTAAHAEEPSSFTLTRTSDYAEGSKVSGYLEHEGDTEEYQVEVDHSVYPEITVYAYTSGKYPGNVNIKVGGGGSIYLTASNENTSTISLPKGYTNISNSSGEKKTYTITAEAYTDRVGYTISVGTPDDFATHLGGPENAATVTRNLQGITDSSQNIYASSTLLNGNGDWYRYTPTEDATYVASFISGEHTTEFQILDAETYEPLYHSNIAEDRYLKIAEPFIYTVMQNRFELEQGKEYLVGFYAPTGITLTEDCERYRVYIGLPRVSGMASYVYTYPQSYTVSANRKTTFNIDVTGLPETYRLKKTASIQFSSGSYTTDAYIDSCKITAPNGMRFDVPKGRLPNIDSPVDLLDFLNNKQNIPLNGRWVVEIQTRKTLTNMHLSFMGVLALDRTSPPET